MAKKELLPKSKTDVQGFEIPRTLGQLRKLLTKAGVKTIHDLDQGYLGSGSQVTQRRFLALRVLCPRQGKPSELRDSLDVYGLNSVWNNAVQLVSQSEEFQAYLRWVPTTTEIDDIPKSDIYYPGSLRPARRFQEETMGMWDTQGREATLKRTLRSTTARNSPDNNNSKRTKFETLRGTFRKMRDKSPVRDDSSASSQDSDESVDEGSMETRDEAVPNTGIILLLQEIAGIVSGASGRWSLNRVHFQAKFDNGEFNTWTDGALHSKSDRKILAIVEAKKNGKTC